MAVFSTNQNRHLYVVNGVAKGSTVIDDASETGKIKVNCIDGGAGKELYFTYKGVDGVMRSDRIQVKNLDYVKAIKAKDMVIPLKSVLVALSPDINNGLPVTGQDYILRINFRQFYGMSDEDQYFKDAAVHVSKDINTAKKFYDAMVKSLNMAFSREVGASKESNPYLTFESSNNGITITEKIQDWTLGIGAQERVYFEVVPTTIFADDDDVVWAKKNEDTGYYYEDKTPAKEDAVVGTTGIGNGHQIADLEYFCMGERGDQYRMKGWPNYIPTKYLVEPEEQYNVLEIHHAFTDTGVNSYRSEKRKFYPKLYYQSPCFC